MNYFSYLPILLSSHLGCGIEGDVGLKSARALQIGISPNVLNDFVTRVQNDEALLTQVQESNALDPDLSCVLESSELYLEDYYIQSSEPLLIETDSFCLPLSAVKASSCLSVLGGTDIETSADAFNAIITQSRLGGSYSGRGMFSDPSNLLRCSVSYMILEVPQEAGYYWCPFYDDLGVNIEFLFTLCYEDIDLNRVFTRYEEEFCGL